MMKNEASLELEVKSRTYLRLRSLGSLVHN